MATFTVGLVAGQAVGGLVVDRSGSARAARSRCPRRRVAGAALAVLAVRSSGSAHGAAAVSGRGGARRARRGRGRRRAGLGPAGAQRPGPAGHRRGAAGRRRQLRPPAMVLLRSSRSPSSPAPATARGRPGPRRSGCTSVACSASSTSRSRTWAVRALGVLRLALMMVAGQLAGGVLIDLVSPGRTGRPGLPTYAGGGADAGRGRWSPAARQSRSRRRPAPATRPRRPPGSRPSRRPPPAPDSASSTPGAPPSAIVVAPERAGQRAGRRARQPVGDALDAGSAFGHAAQQVLHHQRPDQAEADRERRSSGQDAEQQPAAAHIPITSRPPPKDWRGRPGPAARRAALDGRDHRGHARSATSVTSTRPATRTSQRDAATRRTAAARDGPWVNTVFQVPQP